MNKVTIIYKTIPQYRVDFFNRLRKSLSENNIDLELIYGQPSKRDLLKGDTVELEWARKVNSKIFYIGEKEIYWQPILKYLKGSDLVIVEQASKLLVNYFLVLQNILRIRKLAFWGHGKNFQNSTANNIGERIKELVSTKVHWWFAYNNSSADVVKSLGYPEENITIVQNAIDTKKNTQRLKTLKRTDLSFLKSKLHIQSENVAIYVGGIYHEKRIPFLLEALKYIKESVNDFHMIFIGGGIDAYLIEDAAREHSWIHYLGPVFGDEKIPLFAISKVFLMPGLVGLNILDTFALETPLVTTDVPFHSPEIEYLIDGENGRMVEKSDDPKIYGDAVIDLLINDSERQKLIVGCRTARERYTLETMVDRFTEGVIQALHKNL